MPVQNKRASRENTGPHNNRYVKVYRALFIITPIQTHTLWHIHREDATQEPTTDTHEVKVKGA